MSRSPTATTTLALVVVVVALALVTVAVVLEVEAATAAVVVAATTMANPAHSPRAGSVLESMTTIIALGVRGATSVAVTGPRR